MQETFRSRFGLIVALIGMAVGTGNIWRFPRVMAANGGGAFLIPWIIFLFLWSIPLLIIEFSLGQKLKKGVVGCFNQLSLGKLTWLGGFVAVCTLGIMCYYSVVTGWCLFYLLKSITGGLYIQEPKLLWEQFTSSGVVPLCFHSLIVILVMVVLFRGVRKGIESISVLMIPSLFFILLGIAFYCLFLPGRDQAFNFMFTPNFSKLTDYKVWLEALTQSAWSTGAGWGIALTYACYARKDDRPVLTPFTTGFGNNTIELLAAIAVLVPMFTFFSRYEILDLTGQGNVGLTFIALPGLFQEMPGGKMVGFFFFLGLFFAAFTSLVSMFELGVRYLGDMGWKRAPAILMLGIVCFLIGAPSAIDMNFFDNQDWVWGVGLLLSGFFFSMLMRSIGMKQFCDKFVPIKKGMNRFVFRTIVYWLIPAQFVALLGWWFFQSVKWDPSNWWNPFHPTSIGTCLFQWSGLILFLLLMNPKIVNRLRKSL